jgi:ferredoxin-NADP reductase
MREKEGGAVTGALFNVARRVHQMGRDELLEDSTPIALEAEFVGIDGTFVLPEGGEENTLKLLWIAGGIGVTPFLAMLKQLSTEKRAADVQLKLTTREPEVLLRLIQDAYAEREGLKLRVDVFSRTQVASREWGFELTVHNGRMDAAEVLKALDVTDYEAFVCGPSEMEKDVLQALTELGVEKEKIHREGFAY